MRLLGSWWERVPVRGAAPLITTLVVMGIAGYLGGATNHLAGAVGWIWG
jgi:hypothetical protein